MVSAQGTRGRTPCPHSHVLGPCERWWHRQLLLRALQELVLPQTTGSPGLILRRTEPGRCWGQGYPAKPALPPGLSSEEAAPKQVHVGRCAEDGRQGTGKSLARRKQPFACGVCERANFSQVSSSKCCSPKQSSEAPPSPEVGTVGRGFRGSPVGCHSVGPSCLQEARTPQ